MHELKKSESHDFYRVTALDVALIVLILLFSAGAIIHTKFGLNWQLSNVPEASIYHKGKLFKRLKLDKDQQMIILNGKMIVEVKEGRIRVKESDCPRQICVNTGWIRHPGEVIVCVPNEVLIEVKSTGSPVVDAVVY